MKTMKATVAREFHESPAMDEVLLWTKRHFEINGAIQRMHDGQTRGRVMLHRTTLA